MEYAGSICHVNTMGSAGNKEHLKRRLAYSRMAHGSWVKAGNKKQAKFFADDIALIKKLLNSRGLR